MEEIWKKIEGYEDLYKVSSFGRIYGVKRKRLMKCQENHNGYLRVTLCKDGKIKPFFVHRLVAQAFIPNPDNLPQVNHKDENKLNNSVENLEWCTQIYNSNYGTGVERCAKQKMKMICQFSLDGEFIQEWKSIKEASTTLGIHHGNITQCCKGNRNHAGMFVWKYKHCQ